VESPNRKLIRPPLAKKESAPPLAQRPSGGVVRKQTPPDTTNAENFYYVKQMQSKTPMTIVLKDGEELHGVIEWYDKLCIKLNREDGPNLLLFKHFIKYMHKT
jgi:RNA chaperone Hfq